MEGKDSSYRSSRRREGRWDEADSVKRGSWLNNSDERPVQGQRLRGRDWADPSNEASDDGRDPPGDRRDDHHDRRGKDLVDSSRDDVDSWDRSADRRREHRDDDDRGTDRHKSSKGRDSSAEGKGRPSGKIQDEDDDYPEKSRGRDDFYRDEMDDKRRGWKSSKMGRGVKRSWSPDARRRNRVDYDDLEKEWSDDRRDERPYRRDYDRDRDRHRDRDRDTGFHRERDGDFRNWEVFRDDIDFPRDRARDRDEPDRWKHRQKDWQKEKEDDGDYNYERDAWESSRQDNDRITRGHKDGEDRKEKDRGSPQNSGIICDNMDRVAGTSAASGDLGRDRGFTSGSPFMSGRDNGEYFGSNGDGDWMVDERSRIGDGDLRDRYFEDEGPPGLDQNFGRGMGDGSMNFHMHSGRSRASKGSQGQRGRGGGTTGIDGRSSFPNSQGSMMRGMQQGAKMGRGRGGGKGGRGGGRDVQRGNGIPPPMMGPGPGPGPGPVMVPHFGGHMGPPGAIPVMGPSGVGPGGFAMPPYGGPVGWGGGRGAGDMGMHPGLPGPAPVQSPGGAPRFGPNMGPGPGHSVFYNSAGPGRGAPNVAGPPYAAASFGGRGIMTDKPSNRMLPRVNAPAGLAPSRGEQNDYSQHFVDTGLRPQNFIRDVDLSDRFEEYPKLKELITRKDKLVADNACPPMYMQMDLRSMELSPEVFGTKFDVILVDPPWEEYVRRAPGVGDSMEWWTFEEIQNLRIEAIADTPSFIFLWVGDAEGLDQGRLCLKKWGFRRCEDICWVKTNRENPTPALRHDASTILQHSKEHCLMGIRGTVRRSTDGHIIHANIDTDIIISEEPAYGSTAKPEELYHIVEHFALGKRRLELFGEDHNIRAGWITVGKNLSSSNFNAQTYCKFVGDADGKVWQGGRGNPPVDAPHLIGTTPEIEALRPKSPPPRAQQQQSQAANSASQPSAAASNSKKAANVSQGLASQSAQVSQTVTSSSVIVISTLSTVQGQGSVKTGNAGQSDDEKSMRIETVQDPNRDEETLRGGS